MSLEIIALHRFFDFKGSEPRLFFIGVRKTSQLGVSDKAAASTQAEAPRFIAQPKITMRPAATSTHDTLYQNMCVIL